MDIRRPPATWYDVLSFLLFAAFLGLASGVAFGAIALLLAAPAYAAPAGQAGEGMLVLRTRNEVPPGGESVAAPASPSFEAPLLSTDVLFRVSGPIARAHLVQTFSNPRDDWYEGVYVFPLPPGAAVDRLRLRVGERIIEGEIHERQAARQVYEEARRAGRRSALLDQERPNIFTTTVANIGPHETVVVELEYQETLRYEGNRFSLRFPMVVGPRYIPAGPLRVADAFRISPPVMRPGSEGGRTNPVSLRVELDAGFPVADVRSAYHRVDVRDLGTSRRIISLADGPAPANRDFELAWSPAANAAPQAGWFVEQQSGRHYGLMMVIPPSATAATRLPREVIFVLDTSGSMAGSSIRQARQALSLALSRLLPQDRFNVIEFNSYAQALFGHAREADAGTVSQATRWVEGLEARGGTEMAAALKLALPGEEAGARVRQVVFLTDGAVGNEEELFKLIRARLGDSRLFTIGIGSAPNSHFMEKAARLGRGTFTYIGSVEEVKAKMDELFAKIETPVLKSLEVHWPGGVHAEAWPARIPDLYAGEPVVVTVALDRLEGEARLTGERNGERWEARVPLSSSKEGAGLGTMWARAKVASLMEQVREGAAEDTIRPQVIRLATEHRLVTKYTSFVAVDRTPARPAADLLKHAAVPTLLPEGWEYAKVFGELPKGATDSRFAILTGLLSLVAAASIYLVRRLAA